VGGVARLTKYDGRVTTPGRNDPCPCGSGRKYKACCLRAGDALDAARNRLRDAEGRLVPRLLQMTLELWGRDGFQEAIDRFYDDAPCADPVTQDREFESLFLSWLPFCFAPKQPNDGDPAPAALIYLDGEDVDEFDERFLVAAFESPFSFHSVSSVVPGRSLDLEDVLTGETCQVLERTASQTVRAGGVLFARVLTMEGVSILLGMGSTLLPPGRRAELMPLRDQVAGRGKRLTRDQVMALDDPLRHWYLHAADQVHNPPLPKLRNTDGDPLALTTLTFELGCSADDAFAALRSLDVAHDDQDVLEDVERDGAGCLSAFSMTWNKRGNKVNRSWDNTTLGMITVRGSTLTAEVNSNRRAERLKKEVAKRLGRRATFVRSVVQSTDAMFEEMRRRGPRPSEPPPPELAAIEAELADLQWQGWLDEKIAALGNRTPRQAARTAAGREMLEALLKEFEWRGDAPVGRLRAELGLVATGK
jgi:hypothetical protein